MAGVAFERIYHGRYKYRLTTTYNHVMRQHVDLPSHVVHIGRWVALHRDGVLSLYEGYCWDGASGAIDTMTFAKGSLVHDALYQLIAAGKLPYRPWKALADRELCLICREDGMPWWRAAYVWAAVRVGGHAREKYDG